MDEAAPQEQTVPAVAELLGVNEREAETILAQHGYREDAGVGDFTEEDYQELMERPPLVADEPAY
jgi:ribosomal protein S13